MLRIAQSTSRIASYRASRQFSIKASSKTPLLESDAGPLATHIHHGMTTFLAFATPIVFLVPDRWTDAPFNKFFGIILAINVSAHSWIGLNYVATDYVPKISKTLLGPARIVSAGIGLVTLLGLSRIALSDPSIKGTIKGLWKPPKKE